MKIDLKLLKNFGISLSSKKKYYIKYDPITWSIMGIWDDFEIALQEGYDTTLEEYRNKCDGKVIYTRHDENGNAHYENADEKYVGHNYIFYKGFFQNLNMWQLLEEITCTIKENYDDSYYISYNIDTRMKSYADYVDDFLYEEDGKRNPDL